MSVDNQPTVRLWRIMAIALILTTMLFGGILWPPSGVAVGWTNFVIPLAVADLVMLALIAPAWPWVKRDLGD